MPRNEWVIKDDVPLLDEFRLVNDDGSVTVIDRSMLSRIAANNNKRIKDTGDWTPIVIGHTEDGKEETDQPEIVGWAGNFRVKPLFNTGRYAVHGRLFFKKKNVKKVSKFPRRSVELWLGREEMDPISLLGATSPQRDLGLLKFDRNHNTVTKEIPDMDIDKIVQEAVKSLMTSGALKNMIHECLNEMMEGGSEGADGEAPPDGMEPPVDGGEEGPPDAEGPPTAADEVGAPDETQGEEPEAEATPPKPAKMNAGAAPGTPAGTNTYAPGMAKVKEQKRMKRDQAAIALKRKDDEVTQLRRQVDELRLKAARSERERDLIQLESEGVLFDREQELDDVMVMDDKMYKRHLSKIRQRYSRAPVNSPITALSPEYTPVLDHGMDGPKDMWELRKVAGKAASQNKSYAQALRETSPGAEPVL